MCSIFPVLIFAFWSWFLKISKIWTLQKFPAIRYHIAGNFGKDFDLVIGRFGTKLSNQDPYQFLISTLAVTWSFSCILCMCTLAEIVSLYYKPVCTDHNTMVSTVSGRGPERIYHVSDIEGRKKVEKT